jgi:retinol dehydrogenase-12
MQLDLSSVDSIRAFVTEFRRKELPLHYLVNNAGVYATTLTRTSEGFEPHLGVNHLGHFLLTYELVDILKASAPSRIITVSAHGHKMSTDSLIVRRPA